MNKLFAPFLPPWVETGLQPAFYDMESGTVLQQTARMYAKVQQLTRLFNELSAETKATVEEYIAKFVELKDFVDTYFDNLDVQEEINNKLDQMAEDGQLADIISQYLKSTAVFGYDTVEDMKSADNLVNGSFARTLGYNDKDDGNGGLYHIVTRSVSDTEDGYNIFIGDTLTAKLVRENPYIGNVTCEDFTSDNNTKYFVTHIPNKDEFGNFVKLRLGLANDLDVASGELETARSFAERHKATFVANGGVADNDSQLMSGQKFGLLIHDGVFISNQSSSAWQTHWALGIKEDNTLVSFGPVQTEEEARELGCINVVSGFTPLMIDGVSQKFEIEVTSNWFEMNPTTDGTPNPSKTYYTHNNTAPYYTAHSNLDSFAAGVTYYEITNIVDTQQIIGQNSETKDIYFITTNGRNKVHDIGMTKDECLAVLRSYGCDFAYQLDAGGSTSCVYHNSLMNDPRRASSAQTERPCATFLYASYENHSPYSDELNNINTRVSDEKRKEQLDHNYNLWCGYSIPQGYDLNNVIVDGSYYSPDRTTTETLSNIPDKNSFPDYSESYIYGFKLVVEHLTENIIKQTIECQSVSGKTYKFTRQYSYSGSTLVWKNWSLTTTDDAVDITATVEEGITVNNQLFKCKNNRVVLNFELEGTFASGTTKILTLNSKFKPSVYIQTAGVTNDLDVAQIQITNNGVMNVRVTNACTKIRGSVVYDI